MKPVVFFDLDGVLADFVRGALALHRAELPMTDVTWGFPGQIGFDGESDPTFWEPMGRSFWYGLAPLADGFALLRSAEGFVGPENIGILSSPCFTDGCADGKLEWVRKHLPLYRRRVFIGPAKYLVAGPGKILVDDNNDNADKFAAAGGLSVLVPRPWNRRKAECLADGSFPFGLLHSELRRLVPGAT